MDVENATSWQGPAPTPPLPEALPVFWPDLHSLPMLPSCFSSCFNLINKCVTLEQREFHTKPHFSPRTVSSSCHVYHEAILCLPRRNQPSLFPLRLPWLHVEMAPQCLAQVGLLQLAEPLVGRDRGFVISAPAASSEPVALASGGSSGDTAGLTH